MKDEIDAYIAGFPPKVRTLLKRMRAAIAAAAPGATQGISYRIPSFTLGKKLVWYAAFDNHIGFYPGVAAIVKFKRELSAYKSAKGSVRFPLDEPLPLDLVKRIVEFRVKELRAAKLGTG